MKKYNLILSAVYLIVLNSYSQNWQHVGPISSNLEDNNFFETSRLDFISINPSDANSIYTGGYNAGLWYSDDAAENWNNVSTIGIGTNGIAGLLQLSSGEVIVGSCIVPADNPYLYYSEGVFKFDGFTWNALGQLPNPSKKYLINKIAAHPNNEQLLYLCTSKGLFTSANGGTSWQIVSTAQGNVRDIEFYKDGSGTVKTVFISGTETDVNSTDAEVLDFQGELMVKFSSDGGQTFSANSSNFIQQLDAFQPTRYAGSVIIAEGDVFSDHVEMLAYVVVKRMSGNKPKPTRNAYVFQLDFNFASNSFVSCTKVRFDNNAGSHEGRMGFDYDQNTQIFWYGGVKFREFNTVTKQGRNVNNQSRLSYYSSPVYITNDGKVHDDIHQVVVNNGIVYVASDGGIHKGDLSEYSNRNGNIFDGKNHGLNVAMINGFSSGTEDPDYYVIGLQDIIFTNFFEGASQATIYAHPTWENDGGLIDKTDNNLIIYDHASYSSDNSFYVSTDKGATHGAKTPGLKTEFGTNPFMQDPYRKRIYFGSKKTLGIGEFDFNTNKFNLKVRLGNCSSMLPKGMYESQITDMAFDKYDPNDVYLMTNTHELSPNGGQVIKYIGNDFDALQLGQDECSYVDGAITYPQWATITPDWLTGANFSTSISTIKDYELIKFGYKGIEKSNVDADVLYLGCNIVPNNPSIKVMKYINNKWEDYSTGLPHDESVWAMSMDLMSNDGLYLATDKSFYYRDRSMSKWVVYNTNLPQMYSKQMEINNTDRTVRVGTWGRGIWKSPLKCPVGIRNETITYSSNDFIEADQIFSSATVSPNKNVSYKGLTQITLSDGFKASSNSDFKAFISKCNDIISMRSYFTITPKESKEESVETRVTSNVYPNPNDGKFTLNITGKLDPNCTITVLDMIGNQVYLQKAVNSITSIEIEVPSGIYILIVKNGDYTETVRFVKN